MYQFSYLPFFPIFPKDYLFPNQWGGETDVSVNRLHLFNFWKFKDKYINNTDLRNKLQELCEMYVDAQGNPLKQVTIAVIDDNYALNQLSDEQISDLHKYRLALFFCTVTKNYQYARCSSENFVLFHQNFNLDQDWISYSVGSYIRQQGITQIGGKKFYIPEHISKDAPDLDTKLFQAFANMIDAHDPKDERLFKSLDWVRLACENTDGLSWATRIVMLSTAFEMFFDLERNEKEKYFAQKLEDLLEVSKMAVYDKGLPELPKITRKTKDNRPKNGGYDNTIYGWWARDFYWVRSEIIHKGELAPSDYLNHNQVSHHEIALKMIRFCFYRELEKRGYLKYEIDPELGMFSDGDRLHTIDGLREIEKIIQ